jgi:hypothetical protein
MLLAAIIAISFVATLVRSTFGFGESLVAVPLFVLFVPLDIAVPLSVLISIFVALVVVVQDHREIHFNSAKWLIIYAFLGIPIGLLIARGWSAKHFRATLQAYFLPASLFGIAGYAFRGLLGWPVLKLFLLSLPAVIPAVFLGRYFNRRLHGASFFKYVYWGLIVIGCLLIFFTIVRVQ